MRGHIETNFINQGRSLVGIDEVGRGCIAGPVVACCLALDYASLALLPSSLKDLVRDSKTLSTKQRQRVVPAIKEVAIEWAIGQASVGEIEKHNILQATFLAMRRALGLLTQKYDMLLVDGNQQVAGYQGEQMTIISGDDHCYAIAAASIIAKEHRDEYMRQQSKIYPQYGFDHHVGYGTKVHLNSIIEHGICPLHRKTFAPVAKALQLTL